MITPQIKNPAPVPDERQPLIPYRPDAPNPYAPKKPEEYIKAYEDYNYDYPVESLYSMQNVAPQNFDLMRQRAMQTVGSGVQSGMQTGMTQLASSGGLSAADRQAFQAQAQRQKVDLSQGSQSAYDQMASQNLYDTNKFNIGQDNMVSDYNQQILNQRAKDMSSEYEKKSVNIYQQRLKEAILERQLKAARDIAHSQGV